MGYVCAWRIHTLHERQERELLGKCLVVLAVKFAVGPGNDRDVLPLVPILARKRDALGEAVCAAQPDLVWTKREKEDELQSIEAAW